MAARTVLVLAVVVMVNYLSARFYGRFYLSSQTRVQLSSQTLAILKSLTNQVTVTLYYDRQDDFYPTIVALLNEYRSANPRLTVNTVDYLRDAGEAQKVKQRYGLNAPTDKNLIIFECPPDKPSDKVGHFKVANGDSLVQTKLEQVDNPKEREFRRKPVAFLGEQMFTTMLLAVTTAKPFRAYFLQGHGEPALDDSDNFGYLKFGAVLAQNYIAVTNLELKGDGGVPMDCNLLIYAAPTVAHTVPFSESELRQIEEYLKQGGRLLALFNYDSIQRPTGLEPILQRWGVNVIADVVKDPNTMTGQDIKVRKFSEHPLVNPLTQLALQMILPRPVEAVKWANPPPNAPQVEELAFSSPESTLAGDRTEPPRSYPLIAAVEQKPVAGVANPRGNSRIVVAGDSYFLGNYYIEGGANRDFLSYAANWLLDRTALLKGIGPRPVTEFRLLMSRRQQQEVRWVLLGALPGAVLLFGCLVWLVRRK
ncbi:MAG TPA: Gldg family protein [Candidatus Acidoferrum sp.]|nr:Gldg family protein [Candidatus Acidoferrum sp.]